ncbi:MAG: helix-turn-helix domain-containing protein [Kiritimatiellia bacterium]
MIISLEFDPLLPWNRGILKGISAYAASHPDCHILLHRLDRTGKLAAYGWQQNADGVLAEEPVPWALEKGIPQVLIKQPKQDLNVPWVDSDFFAIGTLAARHLIEAGYPHLALLGVSPNDHANRQRERGFLEAAGAAEIEVSRVHIPSRRKAGSSPLTPRSLRPFTRELASLPKPVGFFARNLSEAYLLRFFLGEMGNTLPLTTGLIVGGDDRDMLNGVKPAITGISRNTYAIGLTAMEMLEKVILRQPVHSPVRVPPGGVVARESTRLTAIDDPLVAEALALIESELSHAVTVADLAAKLHTSERTLRRRFLAALRRSPHEEIMRARSRRAHDLLDKTHLSISEIAFACGYAEVSQLSRAIRAETGLTPTQYRKQTRL